MIAAGHYGGLRIILENTDGSIYTLMLTQEQIEQLKEIANTQKVANIPTRLAQEVIQIKEKKE